MDYKKPIEAEPARAMMPVRVSQRQFRRRAVELGLCYKNGHQLTFNERHIAALQDSYECQTLSFGNETVSGKSKGPSKSRGARTGSELERALALANSGTLKPTETNSGKKSSSGKSSAQGTASPSRAA